MVDTLPSEDLNPAAAGLDAKQLRRKIKTLSKDLGNDHKPRLEARIIDLRSKLAKGFPDLKDAKTPEERFKTDLFSGETRIPEISSRDLTPKAIASGVLFHGALLVRGLYNGEQLRNLSNAAEFEYAKKIRDPKSIISTFSFCKLMEAYEQSGLLSAVKGYLGEDSVIALERARLRYRDKQAGSGLAWHQDGSYFGQKCYALNCWAAITECGRNNTGLSIVPRRNHERLGADEIEKSKMKFGKASLDYGNKILKKYIPDEQGIVSPVFQPGDAIIFDEMTLHRTASVPKVSMHQIVSISWFFSQSRLPIYKTPLGF